MISVFRAEQLATVIDSELPDARVVYKEWPAFQSAVPRATCLVVAIERSDEVCSEDALRELGSLGYPPLVLVMPPTTKVLGACACNRS